MVTVWSKAGQISQIYSDVVVVVSSKSVSKWGSSRCVE